MFFSGTMCVRENPFFNNVSSANNFVSIRRMGKNFEMYFPFDYI